MIDILSRCLRMRRPVGTLLLFAGAALIVLGVGRGGQSPDLAYGVSRVDGDPGIAIHWVLCRREAARVVDIEGYWGGSDLPTAVPVFWQVRSDASSAGRGTRVETYVVGQTPAGFYETVPLQRQLPDDLVALSGPPGDDWGAGGMTFRLDELRRDSVYRGDYEFVSPDRFASDGADYCAGRSDLGRQGAGLLTLGLGGVLLAGRARPTVLFIAVLVTAMAALALAAPSIRLPTSLEGRQERSAFVGGLTPIPSDRQVLLDMSPATNQPRKADGLFLARILAPHAYAFVVGCDGPSIHIGEESEIQDGVTGGRQLIGCATGALVRGSIAGDADRADLVEIVVDPNGMTDWRVVVVTGEGDVGPFDEQ